MELVNPQIKLFCLIVAISNDIPISSKDDGCRQSFYECPEEDFSMTQKDTLPPKLNILFVDCAPSGDYEYPPAGTSKIEFHVRPTPISVQGMMEFKDFHCLLIRVDPGSQQHLEQMDVILNSANTQGIPLTSIATFDANWIENLMAQLGIEKHFRQFPSYEDALLVLFQYEDPLLDQQIIAAT